MAYTGLYMKLIFNTTKNLHLKLSNQTEIVSHIQANKDDNGQWSYSQRNINCIVPKYAYRPAATVPEGLYPQVKTFRKLL
jgi:hypothetical protein